MLKGLLLPVLSVKKTPTHTHPSTEKCKQLLNAKVTMLTNNVVTAFMYVIHLAVCHSYTGRPVGAMS